MLLDKIKKSEDIIDRLFDYLMNHFDDFGHKDWFKTEFGSSWSPFVETCFMLEGKKYDYKIRRCSTAKRITEYVEQFHRSDFREKYSHFFKHPCRGIDISWIEKNNNIFLAIEHSEDTPTTEKEIKKIKRLLNYSEAIEDKTVKGVAKEQLLAIREEINKLMDFKSSFKVLISRPRRFDAINGKPEPNYNQSVEYFKYRIEEDLKKYAKSFNNDEIWVIILIVPDPGEPRSKVDKIIFHCYEWKGKNEGGKLSAIDEKHEKYTIPIKIVNGKWVKDSMKQGSPKRNEQ